MAQSNNLIMLQNKSAAKPCYLESYSLIFYLSDKAISLSHSKEESLYQRKVVSGRSSLP